MPDCFDELPALLRQGPVVMATVVAIEGSTPRLPGARQFFAANGRTWGTVGGGVMERIVSELAAKTIRDGENRSFAADLRGTPADIRQGVCGGRMTVWITRLTQANAGSVTESLVSLRRCGKSARLLTSLNAECPLALEAGSEEAFVEVLDPPPRLLVCGAGHIGRAVARMMIELDFDVLVHDDRPEWLDALAFPQICQLEFDLGTAIRRLAEWEGARYAALVTRGFPQDLEALAGLSALPRLDYLGLLGSRKRIQTVLSAHEKIGNIPCAKDALHAPIGLALGAETPQEIAVSIAAEIIQIRRKGQRK